MAQPKVYKFNENQLKLIVESQKSSPQLQTEILDQTANAVGNIIGKVLSFGFKQSVNAFKFFNGIGVNVYQGTLFTKEGKVDIKKHNPLAPLSLYNPTLVSLPQGYQNLFTTISNGLNVNAQQNQEEILQNMTFDDVPKVVYRIKFQFQNLKKDAKENSALMMTTWSLVFKVDCNGKATEQSTMNFTLDRFTSEGVSLERVISQMMGSQTNPNAMNTISGNLGAIDELSLIFTKQDQAQKFEKVMKKQIDDHMKIMIAQLNKQMGVTNAIKTPQVTVKVNPNLIGDSKQDLSNMNVDDIQNDIDECLRQIQLYQNDANHEAYVASLRIMVNRLLVLKQQLSSR
jgi:hypothetical protein